MEVPVDPIQQVAEQLQEINDKLDTILDVVLPKDPPYCPECGIEEGSSIGICEHEACPYSTAE